MAFPPFVCILHLCTNRPVKYLDRLDGCSDGLHVDVHAADDLRALKAALYKRMAEAIEAADDQLPLLTAPDPCIVCLAPIVPRSTFPLVYMENCEHYFHQGCFKYRSGGRCPRCQVPSTRVLLWPELFAAAAPKNEIFQLQKRSLGLDVAPQTVLEVRDCSHSQDFPVFEINVNSKTLTLRKRIPPRHGVYREVRQASYWAWRRQKAQYLRNFRCPFDRLHVKGPNGEHCIQGRTCEFSHGDEPHFPRFFCLNNARSYSIGPDCSARIRVTDQDMVRCLNGFHTDVEDPFNVDAFACKMAQDIMVPGIVDEPDPTSLVCAHCHNQATEPPPNLVRLYLQSCDHWWHLHCFPLARFGHSSNPNRTLDKLCPICNVASVRTFAWPGPFRSRLMKRTIFGHQLKEFNLVNFEDRTSLAIVEVANRVNVFTIDHGGPGVITIDAAAAQDKTTIHYD